MRISFSRASSSSCSMASTVNLRISSVFIELLAQKFRAADDLGAHRKFVFRQSQRLVGNVLGHTGNLKEDAPRLDHRGVKFHAAFALAHTSFSRPFGDGLVREYADPYLAAPSRFAHDSPAGGFQLAGGGPAPGQGVQDIFAVMHLGGAPGRFR